MAVFSSPLSQENRLQIARASFSSNAIVGGGSLDISPVVNTVPQQDPETLKLLEDNQSSLINITSGIQGIQNSVNLLNDSLNGLYSVYSANINADYSIDYQKQQQDRILAEDALRDETEALIERKAESSITSAVQPVAQKTTGTLNSLMGVFGSLFLGWLGNGGIAQIESFAADGNKRFNQVKDTVGSGLRFIGDGLQSIKTGFDNIIGNVRKTAANITEAVTKGLILAPFRALFGKGADKGAEIGRAHV